MIWDPDDHHPWAPKPLTPAEKAWVEQRRRDAEREAAEDRPSRSLSHRARTAADTWTREAAWVAEGLRNATVTLPPAKQGERTRTGSGPSDPTGAQLHATLDMVVREAEAWAHLAGPCPRDGSIDPETRRLHWCPGTATVADVADLAGVNVDPSDVVDGLLGTPPSSSAFPTLVYDVLEWHRAWKQVLTSRWDEDWRAGREPSELEAWVSTLEGLARGMSGLAGRLAVWSGRSEAKCPAGCGGRAEGRGGVCGRCRTAQWREHRQSA